jgi:hypothetical protein
LFAFLLTLLLATFFRVAHASGMVSQGP